MLTFIDYRGGGAAYAIRPPDDVTIDFAAIWGCVAAAALEGAQRGELPGAAAATRLAEALQALVRLLVPDLPEARVQTLTLDEIQAIGYRWLAARDGPRPS